MKRNVSKNKQMKCDNCHQSTLVEDFQRGEIICHNCGMIVQDNLIIDKPERRAYTQSERNDRARTGDGRTLLQHDKGMATVMSSPYRDYLGHKIKGKQRSKFFRLQRHNRRSKSSSGEDRNLIKALSILRYVRGQMSIPKSITENAAMIYRKGLQKRITKGRKIEAIMLASLYVAIRIAKLPRTMSEIAEYSTIDETEIAKNYRLLVNKLQLKIPLRDPINFIIRYAFELGMSGETSKHAQDIYLDAKTNRIVGGKNPQSIAGACLYIAGIMNGERVTQEEIADLAGVTSITIRNRYRQLVRKLELKPKIITRR